MPSDQPLLIEISQAMRNNGTASGVAMLKGIVSVGVSVEGQE